MKLRSGKVIGKKELPEVLQKDLENCLEWFEKLLVGHNELAREALVMIANAWGFGDASTIYNILKYNGIQDEDRVLGTTCGALVGLVIGKENIYVNQKIEPIYHNEIKDVILSFGDSLLVGDQINQNDMDI